MTDKRKSKKRKEEFGEPVESEKASSEEYSVAKWLKGNVPTKKTKFLNHHVEYFTGTKAVDALLSSKWATGKNPIFTTRMEVTHFLHKMLLHKLFHRAKKVPVTEQELKGKSKKKDLDKISKSGDEKDGDKSQASACESKETKENKDKEKDKEKDKKKRKIRLEMHMEQVFLDTADAYVWIYDPMPWYYWLCGALVVVGTIAVCMFPLWPATVRKGVYYLSIAAAGFLVLIIALAVLRLVVFCCVWVVTISRHHFWLLPNLTEDVGFFASFWPLYKYEYRGPNAEGDKAKNKKKKKKDKQSDDETEEKPLLKEEKETSVVRRTVAEDERTAAEDEQTATDERTAAVEEHAAADERTTVDESTAADDERTAECTDEKKDEKEPIEGLSEKQSESESEGSQRSSTEREFEMIEPADLEGHADHT